MAIHSHPTGLIVMSRGSTYSPARRPQAHPTWADLHGLEPGIAPNYILNVADQQILEKAQEGRERTEFSGALSPANCP